MAFIDTLLGVLTSINVFTQILTLIVGLLRGLGVGI